MFKFITTIIVSILVMCATPALAWEDLSNCKSVVTIIPQAKVLQNDGSSYLEPTTGWVEHMTTSGPIQLDASRKVCADVYRGVRAIDPVTKNVIANYDITDIDILNGVALPVIVTRIYVR